MYYPFDFYQYLLNFLNDLNFGIQQTVHQTTEAQYGGGAVFGPVDYTPVTVVGGGAVFGPGDGYAGYGY